MKKILFLSVVLLLSIKAFAQQTDQDAIKQTVNTMFDAMRKGDSTLLRSTFAKDIVFQGVANKKGETALVTENANGFIKAIGTPHQEVYDERITFNDIKIDGDKISRRNAWPAQPYYPTVIVLPRLWYILQQLILHDHQVIDLVLFCLLWLNR
jgi:hypothetical protein